MCFLDQDRLFQHNWLLLPKSRVAHVVDVYRRPSKTTTTTASIILRLYMIAFQDVLQDSHLLQTVPLSIVSRVL